MDRGGGQANDVLCRGGGARAGGTCVVLVPSNTPVAEV